MGLVSVNTLQTGYIASIQNCTIKYWRISTNIWILTVCVLTKCLLKSTHMMELFIPNHSVKKADMKEKVVGTFFNDFNI